MRRGIVRGDRLIETLPDDTALVHHDGADGNFAGCGPFGRLLERQTHELLMIHYLRSYVERVDCGGDVQSRASRPNT